MSNGKSIIEGKQDMTTIEILAVMVASGVVWFVGEWLLRHLK